VNSSNGELYEERCYLAHLEFKISIRRVAHARLQGPFCLSYHGITRSDRALD
jgi:hypothetical protein